MKRNISLLLVGLMIFGAMFAGCASQSEDKKEDETDLSASVDVVVGTPSIFSNKKLGLSFILPAGWEVEESDGNEDALLITTADDTAPPMIYVGRDWWSEQTEESKAVIPRSILSNDLLTEDFTSEVFGVPYSELEKIEFNGYEYYRSNVEDFSSDLESAVVWYRLDHGWFDLFVFGESSDNIFFSQFENLISSAVYDRDISDDDIYEKEEVSHGYLPGAWSDDTFKRNGCTSHPFVLDTPMKSCKGFTVDYEVSGVTDGKMKHDSKFQVFYRISDGTWVKGKEFTLDDDGFASVKQTIKKPVTVTQVTVHCMNSGNFSWTASIGIKDPVY